MGVSWILGDGPGPTIVDIEAVYCFKWVIDELRSLKPENASEEI